MKDVLFQRNTRVIHTSCHIFFLIVYIVLSPSKTNLALIFYSDGQEMYIKLQCKKNLMAAFWGSITNLLWNLSHSTVIALSAFDHTHTHTHTLESGCSVGPCMLVHQHTKAVFLLSLTATFKNHLLSCTKSYVHHLKSYIHELKSASFTLWWWETDVSL